MDDRKDFLDENVVNKKRIRTKFNQEQLDTLESTFQQHRYPDIHIIDKLVEQLDLSKQRIIIWFQNRRARLKRTQQKIKTDDSEIHLDEHVSYNSPGNSLFYLPPPPFLTTPSPYYLHPFYNPIWSNFQYPLSTPSFQSIMTNVKSDISSPLVFQDKSNYQDQSDFHDKF